MEFKWNLSAFWIILNRFTLAYCHLQWGKPRDLHREARPQPHVVAPFESFRPKLGPSPGNYGCIYVCPEAALSMEITWQNSWYFRFHLKHILKSPEPFYFLLRETLWCKFHLHANLPFGQTTTTKEKQESLHGKPTSCLCFP